jgi:uncharacterized protein (TIGR03435 family)
MRIPVVLFTAAAFAFAQSAGTKPVFEAASIKGPNPAYSGSGWDSSTGRITVQNMTLRQLVMFAYEIQWYQVAGGPKWLDDDGFTVVARLEGPGGDPELRLAMQPLLADRFQLAVHKEKREMPAYALAVARGGFKLRPVEGGHGSSHNGWRGKGEFQGTSMVKFADFLGARVDRPVVDATGIQGAYDFTLEWTKDDGADGAPSIFTALQEQLGLKLEARKEPVEITVIDHAEKPDEN